MLNEENQAAFDWMESMGKSSYDIMHMIYHLSVHTEKQNKKEIKEKIK